MKTISFSFLLAILFTGFGINAQTIDQQEVNPSDPAFRKKFENIDFQGKFSIQVLKDNTNNYYLVDFSQFKDKYEKVYFLSLTFKQGKIVNIDGDLSHNTLWFLSNAANSIDEINKIFLDMKERTIQSGNSLTREQKEQWLKENDKYK
jgi:hypothetical protein